MTSRLVESAHAAALRKLILESGFDCVRPPKPESAAPSPSYEEEASIVEVEVESTPEIEEEHESVSKEEPPEEKPAVFPTPSLRRVLPQSFRAVLKENTIHVLPETFKTVISPDAIPIIKTTPKKEYIDTLAGIVGCTEYDKSLAEFWFLDTLANLLRRAQADGLEKPTQALLILWFCQWMKEMQYFDAASRKRMLARFQENMLAAAQFVGETSHIPSPADIFVDYKGYDDIPTEVKPSKTMNQKVNFSFNAASYECSLVDLSNILHYIYDLFSTDYQYNLIRSVFTFPPDYIHVDYPHQIQIPKKLYQVSKVKGQHKPAKEKKEKQSPIKVEKSMRRIDPKHDNDDYEALMELKAQERKDLEEQEERDRLEWLVRNSILPLYMATTDALYDQYWPPAPAQPEDDEQEPRKKGKGKKDARKDVKTGKDGKKK